MKTIPKYFDGDQPRIFIGIKLFGDVNFIGIEIFHIHFVDLSRYFV